MRAYKVKQILFVLILPVFFTFSCITIYEPNFFFPKKQPSLPDQDMGAGIYRKNISIATDGNTLAGIIFQCAGSNDYLLYFYGNGQSIYKDRERLYFLAKEFNLNVICFDYRGYGSSTGEPSFDNLLSDSDIIYDFVVKNYTFKKKKLFIFTQSIGTVPGLNLASNKQVDGIIMEAAFTSAEEAVPGFSRGLPWPLSSIVHLEAEEKLRNKKPQPIDMIKNVKAPLLYIHGTKDEVFAFEIGKKMFNAAGSKEKYFCGLPGTGHSNVDLTKDPALKYLRDYFEKYK
jgi:pimeloyl-ACP methyl ester carboxylesterase